MPQKSGDPTPCQLARGLTLHRQGRLTEAKAAFEVIRQAAPKNFDALNMLGTIALQTGNFQEAAQTLAEALEINPNAGSYSNHGLALFELGRLEEALASYDQALVLRPDHAGTLYNRGNALLALKRLDEAISNYDRAIVLKSDYA